MNGITKQTRRQSYDGIRTRSGERCKLILETLGNRSMTVEEITDELVAAGHLKSKEDKNMLIINIVLALVAALLLFGVIGEKDGLRQQNITIAFVAVIVLIIALNRFF